MLAVGYVTDCMQLYRRVDRIKLAHSRRSDCPRASAEVQKLRVDEKEGSNIYLRHYATVQMYVVVTYIFFEFLADPAAVTNFADSMTFF